ncbi:MAG: hypothetical protein IAG13_14485 [Deltaproteobacteria bacterium]|nr:hypothetical protein [Nannocystaceae bacterium]
MVLPWERAPELPWRHFIGWPEQWGAQPSFLVGEYLFIVVAMVALLHARACGRKHVLTWVAALVAGTANDMFFMALPLVDNFWQAQATVMITPRLPLYIPCVYVCFLYVPKVAVWRLGLPPLAAAGATGLAAILFYAPYDIVGAEYLWWTWHDTDTPIAARILGAPIGSTMWVVTFASAYSWLLDRAIAWDPALRSRGFAIALALVAVSSTPLMMLVMAPLQQLDGGLPGVRGLVGLLALVVSMAVLGWRRRDRTPERPPSDRVLWGAVMLHFASLATIAVAFDPATHVATGIHQRIGPCDAMATDISGRIRQEYLCASDFSESFTLCGTLPPALAQWYTVCGRGRQPRMGWLASVLGLALVGIAAFTWLLRRRSD